MLIGEMLERERSKLRFCVTACGSAGGADVAPSLLLWDFVRASINVHPAVLHRGQRSRLTDDTCSPGTC